MKPRAEDIRAIKPGTSKTFACKSMAECLTAKASITYVKYMGLPAGVSRFSIRTDTKQLLVTITAHKEEKEARNERTRKH